MFRKKVVLLDMGNTLVQLWDRPAWPTVLDEALSAAQAYLAGQGYPGVSPEVVRQRIQEESATRPDHRVRPLEGRLSRIFDLDGASASVRAEACRQFMVPIFARGKVCEDAIPTLRALRARGLRTGILSNTPWGSPASLWRQELTRLGLVQEVDLVVFCDDVGWRKPAPPIFHHAMDRLGADPEECLFVGDDPRWDIAGPQALGMDALLIDRRHDARDRQRGIIHTLDELLAELADP